MWYTTRRLILIIILFGYSWAGTDEEFEEFRNVLVKCTRHHPVSLQDLAELRQNIPPSNTKTKCLLACAYKDMGYIDNTGNYDLKRAIEIVENTHEGQKKKITNGKKVANICLKVNKIQVSDGHKGCDRSALLFKCMVETLPQYGFRV